MRIIAYRADKGVSVPQPVKARREWMDHFPDSRPYHCLPMTVANSYGWEMVCHRDFEATWTGGESVDALTIVGGDEGSGHLPRSRFGSGILTFLSGCIIRTETPYHLFILGPLNRPKDGLSPLSAILDSSWAPFPINMSYQFTRPQTVRFRKGEPWCQIFPFVPHVIEEMQTEVRDLEPGSDIWRDLYQWTIIKRVAQGAIAPSAQLPHAMESQIDRAYRYHHYYHNAVRPNGERIGPRPRPRFNVRSFVYDQRTLLDEAKADSDNLLQDAPDSISNDQRNRSGCPFSSK
jgi:hypothetical protein